MTEQIELTLNTGESSQIGFETEKISGKLDSIIVDSEDNIEVIVESELGYVLFQKSDHHGVKYYAPRAVMQGSQSKLIVTDQFTKFNLNEKISIVIRGPPSRDVKIILRLD